MTTPQLDDSPARTEVGCAAIAVVAAHRLCGFASLAHACKLTQPGLHPRASAGPAKRAKVEEGTVAVDEDCFGARPQVGVVAGG